jgi:hypothetical protein
VVARLVVDALWRNRWAYLAVGMLAIPFWLLFSFDDADPLAIGIPATSLLFMSFFGPVLGVTTMALRELRHLPVTRRDVWRAAWMISTVVPAVVLLATKAIGGWAASGVGAHLSAETMFLSALYDFTWGGALLAVWSVAFAGGPRASRGPSLGAASTIVAMIACLGIPFLASEALPARVDEFTPAAAGVLIAGLAIAFGVLVWTPTRGVLAGERPRAGDGTPRRPFDRTRAVDRLTGFSRVAVPPLFATIALPVLACLGLAAYGIARGTSPWWFVPPAPSMFDPEDVGDRGLTYFVLLPCAMVTMQGVWMPWVRLLKVLPVSVRQINAVLLLTPFAMWAILGGLGWCAFRLAYGTPGTGGVGFVLGLAAAAALAHAFLLRLRGTSAMKWVFGAIGGLMPPFMKVGIRADGTWQIVFGVLAVVAFSAAAIVNHRTLTRSTSSSAPYRRPPSSPGYPAVGR